MHHWKILRNTFNEPVTRYSRVPLVHPGSPNLSADGRALIEDEENRKFISVASLWEIAIKSSLGKLTLSAPFDQLIPQQLNLNGFELLPIELAHLAALTTLPFHQGGSVRPFAYCAGNG